MLYLFVKNKYRSEKFLCLMQIKMTTLFFVVIVGMFLKELSVIILLKMHRRGSPTPMIKKIYIISFYRSIVNFLFLTLYIRKIINFYFFIQYNLTHFLGVRRITILKLVLSQISSFKFSILCIVSKPQLIQAL